MSNLASLLLWGQQSLANQGALVDTAALAAVALVGYLFGRRTRQPQPPPRVPAATLAPEGELAAALQRAGQIATELQQLAQHICDNMLVYQARVTQFQTAIDHSEAQIDQAQWHQLNRDAELLLTPTLKLTVDLSASYVKLRKHSQQLMTFAGSRIDPATGVHNRRAMEEQLEVLASINANQGGRFSLALFSLSPAVPSSEPQEDEDEKLFARFAKLIDTLARETDFVARYSRDEFVVLLAQSSLSGAGSFAERLLTTAWEDLATPAWAGVVEVTRHEPTERLLSRADSALYSARTQSEPCLFQHNGTTLSRRPWQPPPAAPEPTSSSTEALPAPAASQA
jgi:diguanylate cyclase (GGDEF)-like protein